MLLFSNAQVDRLRERRMESFVAEMVEYVRAGHSEVAEFPEGVLRQRLRVQIDAARAAEFTLRSHMRRYVDLSIVLGADFACEGWVAAILSNSDLVPAARLHKLEHEAVFRVRARSAAGAISAASSWAR